jgi:hypothetical protein
VLAALCTLGALAGCGRIGFEAADGSLSPDVEPCVPRSCGELEAECGTVDEGCGVVVDCGTCTAPEICGGAGVANRCGEPGVCVPACDGQPCGAPDGCGGTCDVAGCCADECEAGSTRCADGVMEYCHVRGDEDACVEWAFAETCPSGTCRASDGSSCSPSPCPALPVAITAGPTAEGGVVCNEDGVVSPTMTGMPIGDWAAGLAIGADSPPLVVDGIGVSSCITLDYGELCTPSNFRVCGQFGEAACGDDCEGTECTLCSGSGPLVRRFMSPAPELDRFRRTSARVLDALPTCGTDGFSGYNVRYVMVCLEACSSTSYNGFVFDVSLESL